MGWPRQIVSKTAGSTIPQLVGSCAASLAAHLAAAGDVPISLSILPHGLRSLPQAYETC